MSAQERWRPIVNYEDHYEVSSHGRVRSVERRVASHDDGRIRVFKSRILRPGLRQGYHVVNLSKDGIRAKFYVHRLVLIAFRGEPPPGAECCHYNGIRDDNRLQNLRWDTHLSNVRDTIAHGRHRSIGLYNSEKTHCKRGHLFDEVNTVIRPNGGRACKECRRMMERIRYHAKRNE